MCKFEFYQTQRVISELYSIIVIKLKIQFGSLGNNLRINLLNSRLELILDRSLKSQGIKSYINLKGNLHVEQDTERII